MSMSTLMSSQLSTTPQLLLQIDSIIAKEVSKKMEVNLEQISSSKKYVNILGR